MTAQVTSAVLIAGPTASGKSAFALQWAKRLGGVVINADAMQVYGDLRVLTARPSPEEMEGVPHLLYGHVDGAEAYSVGRWLEDMRGALKNGRVPVIVGGTGLYFDALLRGIAEMPSVPDEVRAHWRARSLAEPVADLHAELARRDPDMAARLRPSDPQRIVRALEVLEGTGRSLAHWQRQMSAPMVDEASAVRMVLAPERDVVRARIAVRFHRMMEEGALEEVRLLAARGLPVDAPVMKALGVAPLAAHLRGACALEEAVTLSITGTAQYAKRQMTWFRGRMKGWSGPQDPP